MAKTGKDYFGWGRLVSIILAIIPVTAWILGVVTRISEGKICCRYSPYIPRILDYMAC